MVQTNSFTRVKETSSDYFKLTTSGAKTAIHYVGEFVNGILTVVYEFKFK